MDAAPTSPRGRGRPTLYRAELCARARDHCRRGASLDQLAGLLGVAPRSIDNWIARIPEFAAAVREGQADADAELDRLLYRRAVGYTQTVERAVVCGRRVEIVPYTRTVAPDARSCMRWLCRRLPQQWQRRPGKRPTDSGVNPAHLIDREAVEVIASLHALGMGYVQPVERVMVCRGEPLIVRYTRQLRPHVRAGMFWLCNRMPEQWRYVSSSTSVDCALRALVGMTATVNPAHKFQNQDEPSWARATPVALSLIHI